MSHALVLGRSLTAVAAATEAQHYTFRCKLAITMRIPPAPHALLPTPYALTSVSSHERSP